MASILYIEDEIDLREDVTEELVDADHVVFQAGDGIEGLEVIATNTPELILCDIRMPRMDGFEFLSEIRKKYPGFNTVPFIFMSALSDEKNILKSIELRTDDYITKPVAPDELLMKIDLNLEMKQRLLSQLDNVLH